MSEVPPNTLAVRLHVDPETGNFSLGREVNLPAGMDMTKAMALIKTLEGVMYMLSFRPSEFMEYAHRVDDAIELQEAIRKAQADKGQPELPEPEFDMTNVHMLPNGRLN